MKKSLLLCYLMLFITLLLVAATFGYLSYSSISEEALRSDKNLITLNGPWKFTTGDNIKYAAPNYDDSQWETISLTAPPGAHDNDVGLSGYIPGWTAMGHENYSGYAWYRMKISLDSLPGRDLALAAPPSVDDAYQIYINGSLIGSEGNFSSAFPIVYSIQPHMFTMRNYRRQNNEITIAFRVWMSSASLVAGAGGIHIAPTIGEKSHIEKKYQFQWSQILKGYIVEVIWPIIFFLLATTIFLLSRSKGSIQSYKWFETALILLGLMRLNQALYFWFQIENSQQAVIVGQVILKPLVLGSWLMAWREWFILRKPKWLPQILVLLVLLLMASQLFGILRVSYSIYPYFETIADYIRLILLALLLFIIYKGMRKRRMKDVLFLVAALLMLIALFPKEISDLNIIPGIWFPFGVGVSRGQFFYVAFVFVMYAGLIQKFRKLNLE